MQIKGGVEYALVVCDHFSRFTQIYATRNKSATSAADKMYNEFILQFGFPTRIHHDQGREFHNRLFKRLHQLAGITSSKTTPYHPMGDGQPERMNRTILNMLKTLGDKEKENWKDSISKLAFAYNSTINKSTGFSPFYLMFGRSSRLPIDNIFGIELESTNVKTYDEFVANWQRRMQNAIEIARENSGKMRKYNEKSYNRKVYGSEIEIGDRVLLKNFAKGGTGKLRSYFEKTAYIVEEKHPDIPVLVIRSLKGKKLKRVHRNNVLKCNSLLPEECENSRYIIQKKPITRNPLKKQFRDIPDIATDDEDGSSDEDIFLVRTQQSVPEGERSDVKESDMVDEDSEPRVELEESAGEESEVAVEESEGRNLVEEDSEPRVELQEYAGEESEVVVEDSDVSFSEGSEEEETKVRQSSRNRRKPKIFTYDELGGNPKQTFR